MDPKLISIIAAAVAVSFGAIGPAFAEGRSVAAAMDAIARQPEAAGAISRTLFVGLAMIETMAIYCLVIALLLGLIAVVFLGLGSYRQGADQARCRMNLAAVQKAVRSGANMQSLDVGDTLASTAVFGAGLMMETAPTCPSGGTYTWGGTVPTVGTAYGSCGFAGPPSHALTAAMTADW